MGCPASSCSYFSLRLKRVKKKVLILLIFILCFRELGVADIIKSLLK